MTLIWFTDKECKAKRFRKYQEAIAWAESNLAVEQIHIRIIGTLSAKYSAAAEKGE